jgi:aliphatic nitrilase
MPFDDTSLDLSKRLFKNSVEVGGAAFNALGDVCRRLSVNVVIGMCERRPNTTGTMYNSLVFIDSNGGFAVHQKYVPTVGERLVHAPGATGALCSFRTPVAMISGLICGENSNPLALYAAARAYPTVHVAAWPQHFSPELDIRPVVPMVSRSLAYSLKTFVINCVGTVSSEMMSAYGADHQAFLASTGARASIIGPSGAVLAEAETGEEQIVYAEISGEDVLIPKLIHDVAGHYNRPELFRSLLFDSELPGP